MAPKSTSEQQTKSWAASLFGLGGSNSSSGSPAAQSPSRGTPAAAQMQAVPGERGDAEGWSTVVGRHKSESLPSSAHGDPKPNPVGGPAGSVPTRAEQLMAQARLSKIDAVSGKVHCLACRVAFPSYTQLAQHIGAKHHGINSEAALFLSHWDSPSSSSAPAAAPPVQRRQHGLAESRAGHAAGLQGHAIPKTTGILKPATRVRTSSTFTLADLFKSGLPSSSTPTTTTTTTVAPSSPAARPAQHTTPAVTSKKGSKSVTISFGMILQRAKPQPGVTGGRTVVAVRGGRVVQARLRAGQHAPRRSRLRMEGAVKRKVLSTTKRLVLQHRADKGMQAAEQQLTQAHTALAALVKYQADLMAELDRLAKAAEASSDPGQGSKQAAGGAQAQGDIRELLRSISAPYHSTTQGAGAAATPIQHQDSSTPTAADQDQPSAPQDEPSAPQVPSDEPAGSSTTTDAAAAPPPLIGEHIPLAVRIAALQLTLPRVTQQIQKAQAAVQAAEQRVSTASSQLAAAHKLPAPTADDAPAAPTDNATAADDTATTSAADSEAQQQAPTTPAAAAEVLAAEEADEELRHSPGTAPCLRTQLAMPPITLQPTSLSNPSSAMAVQSGMLSELRATPDAAHASLAPGTSAAQPAGPGSVLTAAAAANTRQASMVLKGLATWTAKALDDDSDEDEDDEDDDEFGVPTAGMAGWTDTLSAWGTTSQGMQAAAAVNWSSLWRAPGPGTSAEQPPAAEPLTHSSGVQSAMRHLTPPSSSSSANLPGALPALTARLHALQASAAASPSPGSNMSVSTSSVRVGHGFIHSLDTQHSQQDIPSEGSQHGIRVLRLAGQQGGSGQMSSSDTLGSRASVAAPGQRQAAPGSSSSSGGMSMGMSNTSVLAAKLRGSLATGGGSGGSAGGGGMQQSGMHMAWPGGMMGPGGRRETIGVRLQQQQQQQLQHRQVLQQLQQQATTGVTSAPPGLPLGQQVLQLNASQPASGLTAVQSAPLDHSMHADAVLATQIAGSGMPPAMSPAATQQYGLHPSQLPMPQMQSHVIVPNLQPETTSSQASTVQFHEELLGSSSSMQGGPPGGLPQGKRLSRAEMAVSLAMGQLEAAQSAAPMHVLAGMHLPTTATVPVHEIRYWSLPPQATNNDASYVQLSYGQSFTSAVMGELTTEAEILEHMPATWAGAGGQILHEVPPGSTLTMARQDSLQAGAGGVLISPARYMQAGSSSLGHMQVLPAPGVDLVASRSVLDLRCQLCGVQCNSLSTLQQHLSSKKHLTRMARQALAELEAANPSMSDLGAGEGSGCNQTYVGAEATAHSLCHQIISPELNQVVTELLISIKGFQDRALMKDPIKAAAHRWYVCGLREVRKACRNNKARSVIIAPNIEEVSVEGGLDDHVQEIITLCEEHGIPVVFALTRKRMGEVYGHRKRVSAVAVLSHNGVDQLHASMVHLAAQGAVEWAQQRGLAAPVATTSMGGVGAGAGPSQPHALFTMSAPGEAGGMMVMDAAAQQDRLCMGNQPTN